MKFDEFLPRWSSLISTSVVILSIIDCLPARADEATKQRFLREYPAASQFLAERFRHVRCKFEIVEDLPPDIRFINEFCKSGSNEKLESIRQVTTAGQVIESRHVIAMRDRPLFLIELEPGMQRFVDTKDKFSNPLAELASCIRNSKTFREAMSNYYDRVTKYNWSMQSAGQYEVECGQYVYAPWGLGPSQIERIMRDPSFELIDANSVSSEPGIVEVRLRRMSEVEMISTFAHSHAALSNRSSEPARFRRVGPMLSFDFIISARCFSLAISRMSPIDRFVVERFQGALRCAA